MKMVESFPKALKDTVGKGEIAPYEQFLLFPQCFQKASWVWSLVEATFFFGIFSPLTSAEA